MPPLPTSCWCSPWAVGTGRTAAASVRPKERISVPLKLLWALFLLLSVLAITVGHWKIPGLDFVRDRVHALKPVESELQVTTAPRVAPVEKLPIGRWEIEGEGRVVERRPWLRSDRRGPDVSRVLWFVKIALAFPASHIHAERF